MANQLNETHDPSLRSWIDAANDPRSDFPIQNLPFGVFRVRGSEPRIGVAIGDQIVDLAALDDEGLLPGEAANAAIACHSTTLNALMALGRDASSALRNRLSALLRDGATKRELVESRLVAQSDAEMQLPASIGDYTDFYASIHHATNVGSMFRPDSPLLPNYKWIPIGYHGRASSIVPSGTAIRRPEGQLRDGEAPPLFAPSKRLDYEMEVGVFIGPGNALGEPIPMDDASSRAFGFCLVNDWSARDVQTWEYQPLGPFLAKNFATTISPWVVTAEALAPFRVPAFARETGDPPPLPYLDSPQDRKRGGIDLTLEVFLASAKMRELEVQPIRLSRGNFRDMYWTVAQLIAHHTSNGCNLQAGDLIASGTVSGATKDSRGSLLELSWRGTEPFELPTGEVRRFLENGDEVIMRGFCEREGYARIGFGECRGVIVA